MAAEYARHRASREGLSHLIVDSAGTLGIEGERASGEAVQVLQEAGLDLTGHRSRGIRDSDLRLADLVVVMTLDHLHEIDERFSSPDARAVLLRAYEHGALPRNGAADLPDPIGRPVEEYRRCFEVIRACVDHLVLALKHGP